MLRRADEQEIGEVAKCPTNSDDATSARAAGRWFSAQNPEPARFSAAKPKCRCSSRESCRPPTSGLAARGFAFGRAARTESHPIIRTRTPRLNPNTPNGGGLGGGGSRFVAPAQSRACARRTLTLALSHKGRGDLLVGILARGRGNLRAAVLTPPLVVGSSPPRVGRRRGMSFALGGRTPHDGTPAPRLRAGGRRIRPGSTT